jgi:hypothetical protein
MEIAPIYIIKKIMAKNSIFNEINITIILKKTKINPNNEYIGLLYIIMDRLNQTAQKGTKTLYKIFIKFRNNQNKCIEKLKKAVSGKLVYNICNNVATI